MGAESQKQYRICFNVGDGPKHGGWLNISREQAEYFVDQMNLHHVREIAQNTHWSEDRVKPEGWNRMNLRREFVDAEALNNQTDQKPEKITFAGMIAVVLVALAGAVLALYVAFEILLWALRP